LTILVDFGRNYPIDCVCEFFWIVILDGFELKSLKPFQIFLLNIMPNDLEISW